MELAQFGGSGRPDRGNSRAPDVAHVLELLEEVIEEARDAIRAGEHKPVVGVQTTERFEQGRLVARRNDFDHRDFQHVRSPFEQLTRKLAGLLARASHNNPPAEQ